MDHDELVEKMLDAYAEVFGTVRSDWTKFHEKGMTAALRVAVEEVLKDADWPELRRQEVREGDTVEVINCLLVNRRTKYLKPKSDPAVEAVVGTIVSDGFDLSVKISRDLAKQIVAAVRNADKNN